MRAKNSGDTILNSHCGYSGASSGDIISILWQHVRSFFLSLPYRLQPAQLVPSYLHHCTQCGVQSMGPIFIPRDLNIEHREIHWKPLPQNGIMSLEISKPFINSRNPRRLRVRSDLYWGGCQNGPVFPISSSVARYLMEVLAAAGKPIVVKTPAKEFP